MRLRVLSVVFPVALWLAGCASPTPQDRISRNRGLYESFPAEVQRKVSAGEVDIGFTPEMVDLALGQPGRRFTRVDASGDSEVWVYYRSQPRVGFGFGVSSGGYRHHSGTSTGVSVSTESGGEQEVLRVVFQNGKVSAVERVTG